MSKWLNYGRKAVTGFRRSVSNWEDSFYGGYKNVLWDHPEINVDNDLKWDGDTGGLIGYTYNKLIKLFLLSVKNLKLETSFRKNITQEKMEDKWGNKFTRCHISQNQIIDLSSILASSNIELANMFGHYKELLSGTKFYFDIPEEQEDTSGKSSGEGSGDDKDQNDKNQNDKKSEPKKQPVEYLDVILDSIKKKKIEIPGSFLTRTDKKVVWDMLKPGKSEPNTALEDLQASQLLNLLDISFDPTQDKVGSLKAGKLEISKICEVQSGNFNVYYRTEENISTKPFSVCVLIDESGSMDRVDRNGSRLYYAHSDEKNHREM